MSMRSGAGGGATCGVVSGSGNILNHRPSSSSWTPKIVVLTFALVVLHLAVDSRLVRLPDLVLDDEVVSSSSSLSSIESRSAAAAASTTSMTMTTATTTATSGQRCLGLETGGDLDGMLGRYDLVYILYTAKSGSTSTKRFCQSCLKSPNRDNMFLLSTDTMRSYLQREKTVPPFVNSRIANSRAFARLARNAVPSSLVIYLYRDEVSRLKSAIKHVLTNAGSGFDRSKTVLDEKEVLDVIEERRAEIGFGGNPVLTCGFYDSIDENAPNVVFLHYEKVDELFRLLADRHCPGTEPVRDNTGSKKAPKTVRLSEEFSGNNGAGGNEEMDLGDWIEAKANLLQHTFDLGSEVTCRAKTLKMERNLFSCPDETFWYSSHEFL